jgi:tetratricopeptide (TPR) repeat protein
MPSPIAPSSYGASRRMLSHFPTAVTSMASWVSWTRRLLASARQLRSIRVSPAPTTGAAIAEYTKAIELNPTDPDFYNNRGAAHSVRGAFDRSIADHTQAIQMDPNFGNAYRNRASSYLIAGEPAEVLLDVQKSLELRPGHLATLVLRGGIFEVLSRQEEAIADYQRALSLCPQGQKAKEALKRLGALPRAVSAQRGQVDEH